MDTTLHLHHPHVLVASPLHRLSVGLLQWTVVISSLLLAQDLAFADVRERLILRLLECCYPGEELFYSQGVTGMKGVLGQHRALALLVTEAEAVTGVRGHESTLSVDHVAVRAAGSKH